MPRSAGYAKFTAREQVLVSDELGKLLDDVVAGETRRADRIVPESEVIREAWDRGLRHATGYVQQDQSARLAGLRMVRAYITPDQAAQLASRVPAGPTGKQDPRRVKSTTLRNLLYLGLLDMAKPEPRPRSIPLTSCDCLGVSSAHERGCAGCHLA